MCFERVNRKWKSRNYYCICVHSKNVSATFVVDEMHRTQTGKSYKLFFKSETNMTTGVLKQDQDTKHVNFGGKPLFQATRVQ